MTEGIDLQKAAEHATFNRKTLSQSTECGCFHCLTFYSPDEITTWVDKDETGIGQTAVCPYCNIDSVIGSASECPMTIEFLNGMRLYWTQSI